MKESDGMTPRTKAAQPASRLRIVSLGGVDEIGKNMTVFEYEDDIVVVDCGSIFPKEDMLGVDLVIPDVSYLVEKKRNVRGYLFTQDTRTTSARRRTSCAKCPRRSTERN